MKTCFGSRTGKKVLAFLIFVVAMAVGYTQEPSSTGRLIDFTWTGQVSTDWNTAGNWSPATVPPATASIIIPVGCLQYPVITGLATVVAGDVHISTGATITIGYAGSLTVTNSLTIDDSHGLEIQSSELGTGSLISGAISGAGTAWIERYITGYTGPPDGRHFLSSPVLDQPVVPNFSPGPYDEMYRWDEPTDYWQNYHVHLWPTMILCEGYLVSYMSTATKFFDGVPNTGSYDMTNLSYTATTVYHGWHLLGNPYPSALKWNNGDWNLSNVQFICKVLNPGGTYTDLGPNSVIPAANGMMVWVNGPTNSLTIPAAARVHDTTRWYKSADVTENRLKLTAYANSDNTYQETVVGFDGGATEEYDLYYDSRFFQGVSQSPTMWSATPSQHSLSTNITPTTALPGTFVVYFSKGDASIYTMTASGMETFPPDVTITLEDLVADTTQDLRQDPNYLFTSSFNDQMNRFKVHFSGYTVINEKGEELISVYACDKSIMIVNNSGKLIRQVVVYDVPGREVYRRNRISDNMLKIDMNGKCSGCYLIKIFTEGESYCKKVFLN